MDTIWAFRQGWVLTFRFSSTFDPSTHSYDTARKIKERQDSYCADALAGKWHGLGVFPDDLQWEALLDVLRGRVKVDIDALWAFI
jgi:hypothetical protein